MGAASDNNSDIATSHGSLELYARVPCQVSKNTTKLLVQYMITEHCEGLVLEVVAPYVVGSSQGLTVIFLSNHCLSLFSSKCVPATVKHHAAQ